MSFCLGWFPLSLGEDREQRGRSKDGGMKELCSWEPAEARRNSRPWRKAGMATEKAPITGTIVWKTMILLLPCLGLDMQE